MLKLIKTPTLIQFFFPSLLCSKERDKKILYLTFDDGPCNILSPFILDELKKYKAKATFFYLGSEVEKYPRLFKRCIDENHKIGNHTYSHPNGWKTKNNEYYQNIEKANKLINSNLFRPPYGRIKPSQINHLKKQYKIIMWDVLSWDFDKKTSPEECYNNIINNTKSGSIIVLHENEKSTKNVKEVLPKVLSYFCSQGFKFEKL
jgi:peptidoglycan/xylan/chitin deacetylase (PgdA/CDA1 family)